MGLLVNEAATHIRRHLLLSEPVISRMRQSCFAGIICTPLYPSLVAVSNFKCAQGVEPGVPEGRRYRHPSKVLTRPFDAATKLTMRWVFGEYTRCRGSGRPVIRGTLTPRSDTNHGTKSLTGTGGGENMLK